MTEKEKFDKICATLGLDKALVTDVSRAVCCADTLYGDNRQRMDWDSFVQETLPKVQMLRVYVDTLLICTGEGGCTLTCPSSEKAAYLSGYNLRSEGYADEAECLRILDALLADSTGEADEDLKLVQRLYDVAVDILSKRKRTYYTTQDDLVPALNGLIARVRPGISKKSLRGISSAFVGEFMEVNDTQEGLEKFINNFYRSLIDFVFMCADCGFRSSPVVAVSRARKIRHDFHIDVHGIDIAGGGTPASDMINGVFRTGSGYPLDKKNMYKVLTMISRFVNEHPMENEDVKKSMERQG